MVSVRAPRLGGRTRVRFQRQQEVAGWPGPAASAQPVAHRQAPAGSSRGQQQGDAAARLGREGAGDGARDAGPHVHRQEAHELRAAEEAHLDAAAQDGRQALQRAQPLLQHRVDAAPVKQLLDGARAEEAALVAVAAAAVKVVKVVVVVAAVVVAPATVVDVLPVIAAAVAVVHLGLHRLHLLLQVQLGPLQRGAPRRAQPPGHAPGRRPEALQRAPAGAALALLLLGSRCMQVRGRGAEISPGKENLLGMQLVAPVPRERPRHSVLMSGS